MAVDPALHGKGIGTELLASVLATTADAPGGAAHPVLLTTHEERNVTFYRRAGFDVIEEAKVALPGTAPYPVWAMRRAPRSGDLG
jgi:GNAT superfamily N-acetyltransferase